MCDVCIIYPLYSEGTESQRDGLACSKSHSQQMTVVTQIQSCLNKAVVIFKLVPH